MPQLQQLRVVIMSTQKAWHGGEAQAELLAQGLRKRGHQVAILARCATPFPERMANQGYETETFTGRGRNLPALWKIRSSLKRRRPDVLFYNDSHSLTAGSLAALGLAIPVRIAARRVDFALRSPWRYVHATDRVICVSNAVKGICEAGRIPSSILRVVHDGVDPSRLSAGDRERGRASLGLSEQDTLLLTVAKLTDHKGHTYLLRALPAVLAEHPHVVVAFAGDGELRDSLQRELTQLRLSHKVRLLGYRNDVPDLLKAADLVVAPSHLEGLNTSIIDAMLAERPIVTTTAGGIPDLFDATEPVVGPYAWVVPPKTPAVLADAVNQALREPVLAAKFARAARERALSKFTDACMVDGTLAVISEVLAPTRQQAA